MLPLKGHQSKVIHWVKLCQGKGLVWPTEDRGWTSLSSDEIHTGLQMESIGRSWEDYSYHHLHVWWDLTSTVPRPMKNQEQSHWLAHKIFKSYFWPSYLFGVRIPPSYLWVRNQYHGSCLPGCGEQSFYQRRRRPCLSRRKASVRATVMEWQLSLHLLSFRSVSCPLCLVAQVIAPL